MIDKETYSEEFSRLVESIRRLEKAIGSKDKTISPCELEIKRTARKSIVTKCSLNPGDIIKEEDTCYKRPGIGFMPHEQSLVIGKKVKNMIEADSVIKREDV